MADFRRTKDILNKWIRDISKAYIGDPMSVLFKGWFKPGNVANFFIANASQLFVPLSEVLPQP